jgi:thiamine biosynthesis lipoprotein
LINKNAGVKPLRVRLELFKLMERFKQILEISSGAFDITFAGMDTIWRFDGSMTTIPTKSLVSKAKANVGYEKILLDADNQSVFPSRKGMKISFGAIGKEYASDKAKELLVSKQVMAGVMNAVDDTTALEENKRRKMADRYRKSFEQGHDFFMHTDFGIFDGYSRKCSSICNNKRN